MKKIPCHIWGHSAIPECLMIVIDIMGSLAKYAWAHITHSQSRKQFLNATALYSVIKCTHVGSSAHPLLCY